MVIESLVEKSIQIENVLVKVTIVETRWSGVIETLGCFGSILQLKYSITKVKNSK
jgi:hypothetical protein